MDLKTILENVDKEILSEETLSRIEEAFTASVNKKVEERLELEIESALIEMDEDHSIKLERLLNAIDEDHTKKLEKVIEAVESDHLKKLKKVINKYDSELNESAKKHIDVITEEISNYLDAYIDKAIPTDVIYEAAKNTYAANVLEEAKNVLAIDEKFANSKFKDAVKDGAKQITKLQEENIKLKKAQSVLESRQLLEKLTENMPISKANFIKKRLNGKSSSVIKENFKYVANMYKSKETSDLSRPRIPSVDRQVGKLRGDEVVLESKQTPENNDSDSTMDLYISSMNRY